MGIAATVAPRPRKGSVGLVECGSLHDACEAPSVVFVTMLLWGGINNDVGFDSVSDSFSFWVLAFHVASIEDGTYESWITSHPLIIQ